MRYTAGTFKLECPQVRPAVFALLLLILSACGQTGPLYLPTETTPEQTPAASDTAPQTP